MKIDPLYFNSDGIVHPGIPFLLKASIRFDLLEKREIGIEQALTDLEQDINDLFPAFVEPHPCPICDGANRARLERLYPLPRRREAA